MGGGAGLSAAERCRFGSAVVDDQRFDPLYQGSGRRGGPAIVDGGCGVEGVDGVERERRQTAQDPLLSAIWSGTVAANLPHGRFGRDYEYKQLGTVSLLAEMNLVSGEITDLIDAAYQALAAQLPSIGYIAPRQPARVGTKKASYSSERPYAGPHLFC